MKKLFAMLLCAALLMTAGAALAEGTKLTEGTMLTAQGSGTIYVKSDMATVWLGVREAAKDVLEAQSSVNAKIAAVRQALLDAGVKESDISTQSIGIYANYDYSGATEIIAGYTAYNSLSVNTGDIENIGKLIDAAFAAGANSLDNVQFTMKDSTAAQDEALQLAVEDAMRKGNVLAAAAGLTINSVVSIDESAGYSYAGTGIYRDAEASMDGAGTNVDAAQVSVTASVTIQFAAE